MTENGRVFTSFINNLDESREKRDGRRELGDGSERGQGNQDLNA